MIISIILAGGEGKRLWPISTSDIPKQFINLIDGKSSFMLAVENAMNISKGYLVIVANIKHYDILLSQLENYDNKNIHVILEDKAYNTAIAITIACSYIKENFPNSYVLVFPSDHYIEKFETLKKEIDQLYYIKIKHINIFGSEPDDIDSEYGFIKKGTRSFYKSNLYNIDHFLEKPKIETVIQFSKFENYLWNLGIIFSSNNILLNEIRIYAVDLLKIARISLEKSTIILNNLIIINYPEMNNNLILSIDYILIEKAKNILVSELDIGWNDLGSWKRLVNFISNRSNNSENIYLSECLESNIYSQNRPVIAIGLEKILVIETVNCVFLMNKENIQNINKLDFNTELKIMNDQNFIKPWGSYELIKSCSNYKVKILKIDIGAKISLQSHQYREENWSIIKGKAKLTINDKIIILNQGQQVHIHKNIKHRVENIGEEILEILELQTGFHLSENDIIRYDDDYGREILKIVA